MSLENSHRERTLSICLRKEAVIDQLASLLYATGVVKDSENISNIEFEKFVKDVDGNDGLPIKFTIKKEKEVRVIKHNG